MTIATTGITQNEGKIVSLIAAVSLTAHQYRFMKATTGGVTYADGSSWIAGVLQNAPASGAAAEVAINGIVKVEAGGTVTDGGLVESDSAGKAVDKSGAGYTAGVALDAATTDGEFVRILLQPCYFTA